MATTDRVVFLKDWFEEILQGDDFVETTPQDLAYLLYAAAQFSFYGEKTNLGEVFGKEYAGLNRTMSGYYGQIDKVINYGSEQGKKNQKYDNDAIEELAAMGLKQAAICERLGYDITKSKSLSSNPGYKAGRKKFLERDGKVDSSEENCQKLAKTVISTFNF